jgi:long-chain acyl-CoA synthetase
LLDALRYFSALMRSGLAPFARQALGQKTLADVLARSARKRPNALALEVDDEAFTCAELARLAESAAAQLVTWGVEPGDVVALVGRNSVAYVALLLGAAQRGVTMALVHPELAAQPLRQALDAARATRVLCEEPLLGNVRAASELPVLGFDPERREPFAMPAAGVTGFAPSRGAHDLALVYTSGTTGLPKGVRRKPMAPEQVAASARVGGIAYGVKPNQDQVILMNGPMYHSAPNSYGMLAFRSGCTIVLEPRFDPEDMLQLIERHRVTHMHMVPTMFVRLLRLPEEVKRRYDLSSLRFVVHGAAPCPPQVKRAMIEWWGPVINEYYGATEMGNVTFCTSEEWLAHPGTVGKLMPGAVVKVIDEDGNELPPRAIGEVIGRMQGSSDFTYQNDDDKRRRMEKQGLITPGDVGYFDEDGYLYLCDRANDMIISGGVNIYPAEIEAELHKLPEVADCAVFGIPDEEFGEAVCAYVQPQPGVDVDEADLRERLRRQVSGYKMPKLWEFVAELPREDSGKIFKRKLRAPYWEGAGRSI